ncbi:MAG: TraB/GumN family protein [Saprospiraceae bacterium]|nr:TraB/GumN family protein [Saprospiraceae bacterium]
MKPKQSIFWEFQYSSQEKPSYIFGTMHVKDSRVFQRVHSVVPYIQLADRYAAEMALEPAGGSIPTSSFMLPKNSSLPHLVGEKKYQKLKSVFHKAFGLDLDSYQRFLPLFIVNYLTVSILEENMVHSLDEYLWELAKAAEKDCIGVETLREQMNVLKHISLEQQTQILLNVGKNISKFRKQTLQLTELYLSGDIQQLFLQSKQNAGSLRKLLIYNRNKIMADRIAQYSKEVAYLLQ